MAIDRDFVLAVRNRVGENPSVSTHQLAAELNASVSDVVTALPLDMRLRAKSEYFPVIWDAISQWPHTTVVTTDENGGLHATPGRQLPKGERQGNIYTFDPDIAFPLTSLDLADLDFIWFVSKPSQGQESHSVQFFHKDGRHLLSVYLGRNAIGQFVPRAKDSFDRLRRQYGFSPRSQNKLKAQLQSLTHKSSCSTCRSGGCATRCPGSCGGGHSPSAS